jgi:hypothetical protein
MAKRQSVIIVGAGGSIADAASRSVVRRPPLDKGFFRAVSLGGILEPELRRISQYFQQHYGVKSLSAPDVDSLEGIMTKLYADAFLPHVGTKAYGAFLDLLRVFNRHLADTTNAVDMNQRRLLYRVLRHHVAECAEASDCTIITYNQDIQIEKALAELGKHLPSRYRGLFAFPQSYRLGDVPLSVPSGGEVFAKATTGDGSLALLKLHGSLNWYSTHTSSKPTSAALFKQDRKLQVTVRKEIEPEMLRRQRVKGRRMYTMPLVVPAVSHKAGILHNDLWPIWKQAEERIQSATHVTVFGYSCPEADHESANLIARAFRQNKVCENLSIIDPRPQVVLRYAELTGMDVISYYKSATRYLSAIA